MLKKVIRLKDRIVKRNKYEKRSFHHTIDSVVSEIHEDIENDSISDVVIVWRSNLAQKNEYDVAVNYIWWNNEDRYSALGLLDYIKKKIMNQIEFGNTKEESPDE